MADKGRDFAFGVADAPPPDKMADEPEEKDEADDSAGLVSAVHDLAKAFGVAVKDEGAAVAAVRDICRLSGSSEETGDDEG